MVELGSQVLPQLVVTGDPVQDKVRHIGGTVASKQRSAKVGHAGLGIVLHQLGAEGPRDTKGSTGGEVGSVVSGGRGGKEKQDKDIELL